VPRAPVGMTTKTSFNYINVYMNEGHLFVTFLDDHFLHYTFTHLSSNKSCAIIFIFLLKTHSVVIE